MVRDCETQGLSALDEGVFYRNSGTLHVVNGDESLDDSPSPVDRDYTTRAYMTEVSGCWGKQSPLVTENRGMIEAVKLTTRILHRVAGLEHLRF